MNSVVIFSPSRFSLYTICVTELLRRNNIKIKAIYVRKLFNPKRFFSEFSRDGSRLIKKIWKKLFLQKNAYMGRDYETIVDFLKQHAIAIKNIDEFTEKYDIPVFYCSDLNDPIVIKGLEETKPDLVVFTGGGLIRKDVLKNSGHGVVNCHMGVLPTYRGMDVVEWPILEGNIHSIGMTVHFMAEGIDTGDILHIRNVEVLSHEGIKQIREKFEPLMCIEMVDTCINYLDGRIKRNPQKIEEGKQYFVMHPRLIDIAGRKLNFLMSQVD